MFGGVLGAGRGFPIRGGSAIAAELLEGVETRRPRLANSRARGLNKRVSRMAEASIIRSMFAPRHG